jgi:hypothetical protein
MFGFTVNTLSLFGLVLAIGLVVDKTLEEALILVILMVFIFLTTSTLLPSSLRPLVSAGFSDGGGVQGFVVHRRAGSDFLQTFDHDFFTNALYSQTSAVGQNEFNGLLPLIQRLA